jgi:hypothetical protein
VIDDTLDAIEKQLNASLKYFLTAVIVAGVGRAVDVFDRIFGGGERSRSTTSCAPVLELPPCEIKICNTC